MGRKKKIIVIGTLTGVIVLTLAYFVMSIYVWSSVDRVAQQRRDVLMRVSRDIKQSKALKPQKITQLLDDIASQQSEQCQVSSWFLWQEAIFPSLKQSRTRCQDTANNIKHLSESLQVIEQKLNDTNVLLQAVKQPFSDLQGDAVTDITKLEDALSKSLERVSQTHIQDPLMQKYQKTFEKKIEQMLVKIEEVKKASDAKDAAAYEKAIADLQVAYGELKAQDGSSIGDAVRQSWREVLERTKK